MSHAPRPRPRPAAPTAAGSGCGFKAHDGGGLRARDRRRRSEPVFMVRVWRLLSLFSSLLQMGLLLLLRTTYFSLPDWQMVHKVQERHHLLSPAGLQSFTLNNPWSAGSYRDTEQSSQLHLLPGHLCCDVHACASNEDPSRNIEQGPLALACTPWYTGDHGDS